MAARVSDDPAPARPRMPTSVRLAVGILILLGILQLLLAMLLMGDHDAAVQQALDSSSGASRASIERQFAVFVVRCLVLAVIAFVAAWGLSRRRAWGRWTGIGVAVLLGGLTFLSVLAARGGNLISLTVLFFCVVAGVSLCRTSASQWIPLRRRTPPADPTTRSSRQRA